LSVKYKGGSVLAHTLEKKDKGLDSGRVGLLEETKRRGYRNEGRVSRGKSKGKYRENEKHKRDEQKPAVVAREVLKTGKGVVEARKRIWEASDKRVKGTNNFLQLKGHLKGEKQLQKNCRGRKMTCTNHGPVAGEERLVGRTKGLQAGTRG